MTRCRQPRFLACLLGLALACSGGAGAPSADVADVADVQGPPPVDVVYTDVPADAADADARGELPDVAPDAASDAAADADVADPGPGDPGGEIVLGPVGISGGWGSGGALSGAGLRVRSSMGSVRAWLVVPKTAAGGGGGE